MEWMKIADSWLVTVMVYISVALFVFLFVRYRQPVLRFFSEVRGELVRCSWPWNPELTGIKKYKELIDSTVVVAICALLLASYVATFDFLIMRLVGWLVRF